MAYQKTRGRSVTVSPTGMPDLSGYKQFAGTIDRLSDMTMSIGADIRRQEFNDMLIQAEKEGRTAGVRYDKDGNLVPLVDTTYASAMKAFGTEEQRVLQQAYKKSAISTYSAQLAIDAGSAADVALTQTPTNPDAINGAARGYLESLQDDLDPDVFNAIAPRVNAEFQTRVGRARAGLLEETRKNTIETHTTRVGDLYKKLGVIGTVGAGSDPEAQEGTRLITEEIIGEIEESFETLKLNGITESEIEKIRRTGQASVQFQASKGQVEKIYYDPSDQGGFANALAFAIETGKEFAGDERFDSKQLEDAMIAHARKLKAVTDAGIAASTQNQIDVVGTYSLKIQTGQVRDESEILSLPIDDQRISSLLREFRAYEKAEASDQLTEQSRRDAEHKQQFDGHVADYIDTTRSDDERTVSRIAAETMYANGLIDPATWKSFVGTRNAEISKQIMAAGNAAFVTIEHEISKQGGYLLTPEALEKMEPELIAKGFIGEGKAKSMSQWRSMIRDYKSRYQEFDKKRAETNRALAKARSGQNISQKEKDLIVEQFAPMLQQDDAGNVFEHANPEIAEQNMDLAVAFSVKYRTIHPEILSTLNGINDAQFDSDLFENALQIYNKIYLTMAKGINQAGTAGLGVGDLQAEKFLKDAGVDTAQFNILRFVGGKIWAAMQSASESTTKGARISNSIKATFGSIDEAIEANFNKYVAPSSIAENALNNFFGISWRDPDVLKQLDQISVAEGGDITEAYIRDPRLKTYLKMAVPSIMQIKNYPVTEEGIGLAIREAVVDVSDSIGVNIDEDGNSYVGFNTWYQHAAASIGANVSVIPNNSVQEAFFRELRRHVLRPDVAYDQKIIDMVKNNEGTIRVEPDAVFGRDQTYSAWIIDEEGNSTPIVSGFRYDYNRSFDNKIVTTAVARVKNSTIKKFFSQMSLLTPSIVEGVAEDILEDYDEESGMFTGVGVLERLNGAINAVKPVAGFVKPSAGVITTPTIDAQDTKLLRDWAMGKFNDQEYLTELMSIYE